MKFSARRSPHGERGLKCFSAIIIDELHASLPSRGAWIEIIILAVSRTTAAASLPSRGAWIEIAYCINEAKVADSRSPHGERGLKWSVDKSVIICPQSLPSRGAWIEI